MRTVAIIGAGGFAREILWLIRESALHGEKIQAWGFLDDNQENYGKLICDLDVKGGLDLLTQSQKNWILAVCAVGSPPIKKKVVERALDLGIKFTSVIAPDVKRSNYCEIGEGSIICAGNILTTQIKIGEHVIVNLDCSIGHDVIINNFATIAPGVHISGNCTIGKGVDIGTGANLIQGIKIGDNSIIGAGSTVIEDIPPNVTAVGVPAKIIKKHR